MGSNVEEAIRAKVYAEKQFVGKNIEGAKHYALKAQMLCPELEGISQMVATFGVYVAAEAKINGEPDFYSILGMHPSSKISKLKKQYKKLAVLLHPENNKTVGADGAYLLISEAWAVLCDAAKRNAYDQRRSLFAGYSAAAGAGGYGSSSNLSSHGRSDTFWTICTSCHVQYEYLRKYVDKRLSCKNCRGVFIAVETGLTPVNGAFPYNNYTYPADSGHRSHGSGVTYTSTTTGYHAPNGAAAHHPGYRSDCISNISFQGSSPGNSIGFGDSPNGLSPTFAFYQANGEPDKTKASGRDHSVKGVDHVGYNGWCSGHNGVSKPKRGRPAKIRKVEPGSSYVSVPGEVVSPSTVAEPKIATGSGVPNPGSKLPSSSDLLTRRCSAIPAVDGRRLLIDRAKSEIHRKLEEMRLASEAAAAEAAKIKKCGGTGDTAQPQLRRNTSMAMAVPDSDFHDFDQDRSEECFKPKQIWALYDEEDGMPRLYCLIRDIISVNPFKIYISYLSSKSDNEFGLVNWLDSGFTKSCGNFRVFHSETVDEVNIFSHLLGREKAGRGGCVRIYPRTGDIWAVYRNWSPDWNRTTLDEVRHQYEMVEVLDDYSEEYGVRVIPLVKLDGFKTVYRKNSDKDAMRWIPRREMLRFSHQVPSYLLKPEETNLPEGCWDLDPAAMPNELFKELAEPQNDPGQMQKTSEHPEEQHTAHPREYFEEPISGSEPVETLSSTPFTHSDSKRATALVDRSEEKFSTQEAGEAIVSTLFAPFEVATKPKEQEIAQVTAHPREYSEELISGSEPVETISSTPFTDSDSKNPNQLVERSEEKFSTQEAGEAIVSTLFGPFEVATKPKEQEIAQVKIPRGEGRLTGAAEPPYSEMSAMDHLSFEA